jgi:hypothetical protein
VPEPKEAPSWWGQYAASLVRSGRLSSQAIAEVARVSSRVAGRLAAPGTASRTVGAVVGAVQSGKTGAMAGIAAMAMDGGYDVVIVLSGLREDLRSQTARRFKQELLDKGDRVPYWAEGGWTFSNPATYDHPLGKGSHGPMRDCWSPAFHLDVTADQAFPSQFVGALERKRKVLLVVKKNSKVLERLHAVLADARKSVPAKWSMLVLDDECDEASPGNGGGEAPTSESIKQLILQGRDRTVAYVGVTATVAANVLLDSEDPLFPRDFVEVARYAGPTATVLTFEEPDPNRRYTGGFSFYQLLEECGHPNFLVDPRMSASEQAGHLSEDCLLADALVAYFVSGAMRLGTAGFGDSGNLPAPHSMILHTDGRIKNHRELAHAVVKLIDAKAGIEGSADLARKPEDRMRASTLQKWLERDQAVWFESYKGFCETRGILEVVSPGVGRQPVPSWEQVMALLPDVFSAVKLRIVNSDDHSDEPPLDFGNSAPGARPYDIYSIIIGGNRLSRGLTIEGLCAAYFTRVSEGVITEDTTIQRARWFGYRGKHLEYCRLFIHEDTANVLAAFHSHEADLRRQFAWMVNEGRNPADTAIRMLCLPNSRPTARTARGEFVTLSLSGTRVFVPRVQMGASDTEVECARHNEDLAADWWARIRQDGESVESGRGETQGYVLRDINPLAVADLLDAFRYHDHNPDPSRRVAVALRSSHRPRLAELPEGHSIPAGSCPYMIAAYLRFWAEVYSLPAAERRDVRDEGGVNMWSASPPPVFNVGFRFGSMNAEPGGLFPGARLLDRGITARGNVMSRWGGHGTAETNHGDEWFDMTPPTGDPNQIREPGLPGLLLLHVAHREAKGRRPNGKVYSRHRPFVGLNIPGGGPSLRAVVATPQARDSE